MGKSLQDQLLGLGLTDNKKQKKNEKEKKRQEHLKRTGQENNADESREKAEQARKEKAARDKELNKQRDEEAQKKAIKAQVQQLVDNNLISAAQGDIKYQFVDGKKVKSLYVDQAVWDRLSKGQLAIIAHHNSYAVIPLQVAEKIRERDDGHFIVIAEQTDGQMDEDDPYAAYQIPDDLMW
ncbi:MULTISPECIES: DUF2058 domain-containing protein [Thalassolituus]|uniref:DUF2058 domain-containing protein n=1 Tax=Thalassolituus TaxID=187492 RepID=UPI000C485668|nr:MULTISPECIES: DUF2058 domain-containing protein [Thalassolituus]MAX85949.1 nucleoprotein/polynucleotide-associated enzyme [Oceanospirillaceae bacterium]MEC8908666.1 DUF2058 domain-containing protein [Pseudomonadota bacterium]|tara:strand:- start:453 stop:995 length:543 start_codon:yes stop_codon:yes gene_type:complete